MEFSELLRIYRESYGYTQNGLAKAIGVHSAYINNLESGKRRNPSRAKVDALCAAMELFGMEADNLRIAAGYCPKFAQDASILHLAYLLETLPPEQVRRLRERLDDIVPGGHRAAG